MPIRHASPKTGEILLVEVITPFLLAHDDLSESTMPSLALSAGQLPTGVTTVRFRFPHSEYGHEMATAVRNAIAEINGRWGIPGTVDHREFEFTGLREEPFKPRKHTP